MLCGCTPQNLTDLMPEKAWGQGFTSRLIMIFSDERIIGDDFAEVEKTYSADLANDLAIINEQIGQFEVTKDYRDAVNNWRALGEQPVPSHPKLIHYVTRRRTHLYKLSMVSAIDRSNALIKSKYVREEFANELDRLADEIINLDPNLIICLGNCSLWALAGRTGITKLRGTTLLSTHTAADFKLLPTYHPSAILRQWDNRPTVIADLMKAKRESAYPEIRRPPREIWIEPTLDDIRTFKSTFIDQCKLLSVDIETSGQRVTCIGFAPSNTTAIVIPFDDARQPSGSYWPTRDDEAKCWNLVRSILGDSRIPKLFQNGAYDISFLLRAYGIKTLNCAEDTMLLSHALQPEGLKGLGYLGSIYSDEGAWKHMRKKDETIKRGA